MEKREQIERLIQKTLDQFEHPETLPPNPYLYVRIRQRLESQSAEGTMLPAFVRPVLLAVLVALNVLVSYLYFAGAERHTPTDARQELIDILADDLNMGNDQTDLSINE